MKFFDNIRLPGVLRWGTRRPDDKDWIVVYNQTSAGLGDTRIVRIKVDADGKIRTIRFGSPDH